MGGTVGLGQRALGIAARCANQLIAQGFGPLASDQAHATGGGMEQHKVTGLQTTLGQGALEQKLGGHAFEHHGRAGVEVDRIGQFAHHFGRHHPHFAIAARGLAGIGRAVPHLEVGDARAHGLDHARSFHAQVQGHGQGVQTGALVHVDEIQAHRFVADADFTGARVTHGDINDFEDFGTTVLVNADSSGHV